MMFAIRRLEALDEVSRATSILLDELQVDVAPQSVASYLRAHPSFPSLAAVLDCLDEFGVRASGLKTDVRGLAWVKLPAMITVKGAGTDQFWVVRSVTDAGATCITGTGEVRQIPTADLETEFRGVVLQPNVGPSAGERGARELRRVDALRAALPTIALLLCGLLCAASAVSASLVPRAVVGYYIAALGLAWAGFAASVFMSLHEMLARSGSRMLDKVCPAGRHLNCAKVLASRYSRVLGVFPLADLGAAFFAGEIAALTIGAVAGWANLVLIGILIVHAVLIPGTIASIVLQSLVLRTWCWMCVLVQTVVWAELITAFRAVGWSPELLTTSSVQAVAVVALSFSAGALGWGIVRALASAFPLAPQLQAELERLRSLPAVVEATLAKSPPRPSITVPEDIVAGAPQAPVEIVMVSDPLCSACANAHSGLAKLLNTFPKLVRASTILAGAAEPSAAAARRILAAEQPAVALEHWYESVGRNGTAWLRRKDHAEIARDQDDKLEKHSEILRTLAITGTPTIYIDGRRLDSSVDLKHLRFYLRSIQQQRAARERAAAAG
jgi:protein-disulfide isomerase/uncharacterized membrane protein